MSVPSLLAIVFGIWMAAGVALSVRALLRGTCSVGEIMKRVAVVAGVGTLALELALLGKTVLASQHERREAA